jgi:hypothetical protein
LVACGSNESRSDPSFHGERKSPALTLETYRKAFIENNPNKYMSYLSNDSKQYLAFLKQSSLTLPAEEVAISSPYQQYFILAARALLSKSQVLNMDIYEFHKKIDTYAQLLIHPEYKILNTKISAKLATIKIKANNQIINIPFILENGQWKINLKDKAFMKVIDDYICKLADSFGCDVIGLVNLLNQNTVKKVTYEILNPLKGESTSITEPKPNHLFIGNIDKDNYRSSGVLVTPWGFSMRGKFKNWELVDGGEIYYANGGYIYNASIDLKNDIMRGHYVISDHEEFIGNIKRGHPHGVGKCVHNQTVEKCTYNNGRKMQD